MSLIVGIIGIGLIAYLVVSAFRKLSEDIQSDRSLLLHRADIRFNDLRDQLYDLETLVKEQHKKTRKETQEIKTRLTRVRRDLNKIEKHIKK